MGNCNGNENQTTVVIPNWNGIKYLENCLKSLGDYPIILVDNGSKDGSVAWIQEHFASRVENGQISFITFSENKGFCAAANAGIKAAKTPFVFLLNNDTVTDSACISYLEKRIDCDNRIFSVQAKMLSLTNPELIDDAGDLFCALGWAFGLGKNQLAERYNHATSIFAACAGAALYRKSLFEKIGYFDENHFAYLEDMDLGYRARILGYDNVIEPKAVVYHAGSASSGSRHNAFKVELSARNSIYMIYKNMPLLQLLLNLGFILLGILVKAVFFWKKGLLHAYGSGLYQGIRLCISTEGQSAKVRFNRVNLVHYVKIQLLLWVNTVRRFIG